ncbi:GAF and ANTAR domain-containing protein [Actinomycetospora lemnae]|uniref:GAF and ANTAR domain-containing protein n=1 Tax=Actinomycetospora lemnae TaxID=3019891 RepID=A0ABT5T1H1_9PSEU|nr:GAF and ANTAR domain-containing protein [Actinomycetospora sp. DW7H6]MDD7968087.1 GAF and ANTAR domain-containing protein [Actinomycetospora sp. DW7H6]
MTTNEELVVSLRNAARGLTSKHSLRDLQQTLAHIVAAAVQTVPQVDAGGVSLTEGGVVTSRHPTNDTVTELDQLQSTLRQGPCITALEDPPEDGIVVAMDLAGDDGQRWPDFAPAAVEAGYRSLMSTQLSTDGGVRAALNLYASGPHVFDADARLTAGLFGVQAAMLLYGSEQAVHLQRAVDTRDVIGQAKGILMERFALTSDGAFHTLVTSSQETNIKLVDVARWLHQQAEQRGRAGHAVRSAPREHVADL